MSQMLQYFDVSDGDDDDDVDDGVTAVDSVAKAGAVGVIDASGLTEFGDIWGIDAALICTSLFFSAFEC